MAEVKRPLYTPAPQSSGAGAVRFQAMIAPERSRASGPGMSATRHRDRIDIARLPGPDALRAGGRGGAGAGAGRLRPTVARSALRLLLAGLAGLVVAPAWAQIPVPLDPLPDADSARRAVYGGPRWSDARLADFFGGGGRTAPRAEVREVFRARYAEREVEKLMLVYQLTPGPRDQFRCATCVPALGAAVMAADAQGRWQVRARGLLLAAGTPGAGDEDLQMLQVDDERWMLRSRRHDNDRGLETRNERLLMQRGDQVALAVDLGFDMKPGPQACGAGAAPQSSGVSVLSPGRGPRVEIVLRFNEGRCPHPEPRIQRTRLQLIDDRFELEVQPVPEDPADDPSTEPRREGRAGGGAAGGAQGGALGGAQEGALEDAERGAERRGDIRQGRL